MYVPPLPRQVRAEDLPLDKLAGSTRLSQPEKLDRACRAFEAILLRQVLTDAQKPVIQSKYTSHHASRAIYQDLVTEQLADGIARSGALGLARSLELQFQPPGQPRPETGSRPADPGRAPQRPLYHDPCP